MTVEPRPAGFGSGLEARVRRALAAPPGPATLEIEVPDGPTMPAAVLVPIVCGPAPGVLLTKRASGLRRHAGQVSFPGGRIDPTDAHPEAAALREAREELGLEPGDVEIVGRLPDLLTGTGFLVTPIVGLLPPGLSHRPAPAEVDAVFELPMAVLLDPGAPTRRSAVLNGRTRHFWVWPHPDYDIWGATAAILLTLARRLRGDEAAA